MITNINLNNNCCICDEIKTGLLSTTLYKYYPIQNRFCFESKDFIVVPSVSPLNAGHILIFTKEHNSSMMSLSNPTKIQLFELVDQMYNNVQKHFGSPIIFEHGANDPADQGCGVNHAHIHILPLEASIRCEVMEEIKGSYLPDNWGNIQELLSGDNISSSYLLYGEDTDNMFFYNSGIIPSQSIRRIISAKLGKSQWNWKEYYGWRDFKDTYKTFHAEVLL